jgi:hypothetical protein
MFDKSLKETCLTMDVEQEALLVSQLPLFEFGEVTTGLVELFPTVWGAAEGLSGGEARQRQQALDLLVKCGATGSLLWSTTLSILELPIRTWSSVLG